MFWDVDDVWSRLNPFWHKKKRISDNFFSRATLRPSQPGLLSWTFPDPLSENLVEENPDQLSLSATFRLVSHSWLLPIALQIRGASFRWDDLSSELSITLWTRSLGAHGNGQEYASLRYTVLQFQPLHQPLNQQGELEQVSSTHLLFQVVQAASHHLVQASSVRALPHTLMPHSHPCPGARNGVFDKKIFIRPHLAACSPSK